MMLNVVLYAPRIPQNTGQIARTCWAMDVALHLIRPLGFRMDEASLRRAAVGYLAEIPITIHQDLESFQRIPNDLERVWLITKFGNASYLDVSFHQDDWLIFGSETEGLPFEWLQENPQRTLKIPMLNPKARCLNLSTSVTAVTFEAIRQIYDEN